MTTKMDLIARIVASEWKMFVDVPNAGGKASCQEDSGSSEIFRSSQFVSWSEAALESYLLDLAEAENSGRNLLTEKYARMMGSTSPADLALIEHLVPPLAPGAAPLIDQIVEIMLAWEEVLWEKYPNVLKRGRPLRTSADTQTVTSMETYLRGELATYSLRTLRPCYENILRQRSENVNGSQLTLEYTVSRYGFKSLEEANERSRARG
ncbi:MAG: DUF4125 family protein [Chloroflexota bacterium]